MAFRHMSSNELCETQWIKQNNSSQSKIKTEEGHWVHSLFNQLFTNANLKDFTSEDGLSNCVLSKSFSEDPWDPKIQGAVEIQKDI